MSLWHTIDNQNMREERKDSMDMKRLYLVTGAYGHLGHTIVDELLARGEEVRGLALPGDSIPAPVRRGLEICQGDVCDPDSLVAFFHVDEPREIVVIHTAGIVSIASKFNQKVFDVNVVGTKNIVDICRKSNVRRLVHVSSVHAIPEQDHFQVLHEVRRFSPDWVVGGYAKTKAEATQAVLDAVQEGLDAVVVHPSGILGPYDRSGNHLVQLVNDYINGKLPACVNGGYDFVDVRDVADGCLKAIEKGKPGECFILSNRHYEVKDVLHMTKRYCGGRRLPVLPMWMAKAAAPLISWVCKLRKRRPLYTKYSLYTLSSNDKFSHDKATVELGYRPRDLAQTIRDTIAWLKGGKLGSAL